MHRPFMEFKTLETSSEEILLDSKQPDGFYSAKINSYWLYVIIK